MNTIDGSSPTPDRRRGGWALEAWADLVWGSRCVGCATPGGALCENCRPGLWAPRLMVSRAHDRTAVAGRYTGALRAAVVAHKEDGVRELAGPLAAMLAGAVALLGPSTAPTLLVPVPSRASARRERGDDPWARVVRRTATGLRLAGTPARCLPLLRVHDATRDQAGLGAVERGENLAGAMTVDARVLGRSARGRGPVRVVLCDDVLTTGATASEAVRALRAVGIAPAGCALLADVVRRDTAPDG